MKQNVLISGASRGLGYSIAQKLATKGFRLILTGRSAQSLNTAVSRLTNASEHIPLELDLIEPDSIDRLMNTLSQCDVVPNIIIHSLGGKVAGDCHPLNVDILRESMSLNLEVAVKINNAFIPLMRNRASGTIIHISSDAAITANAAPAYSIAKAALNAYVLNVARNYIKDNIVIFGVLPGIFEHSDSVWSEKKNSNPEYYRSKVQNMPLGRFMRVDEVSEVISMLCSVNSIAMCGSLIKLNGSAP